MKRENFYKLSFGITLLAVLICLIAAGMGYHLHVSGRAAQKAYRQSIESLKQDVLRLEDRLAKLDHSLAALQDLSVGEAALPNKETTKPSGIADKKAPVVSQSHDLKRLEHILDSTGLKQLAENGEVDPQILQKVYDEYVYRDQIASHRENLLQINRGYHGVDDQNYDEHLQSLYQRARIFRRGDTDPADREKAFGEMLEKYPDAYATGMVIAERAIRSAFRRDTSEVEDYYDLLRANDNFSNVVTDRGIEAMPNLEYYIARQYIRDGRVEDARVLLNSLEENYPDSYIRAQRRGYRPRWQPVSQAVEGLYQKIR